MTLSPPVQRHAALILLRRTAASTAMLALFPSMAAAQQPGTPPEPEQPRTAPLTEVVVVGRARTQDGPVALPVTVLAGDELAHRRQGGLGETLAGLPGVHLDNFGGGASRPVMRGQTLPRIEILSDGANVFDAASVSPDHAIGTDPLLLDAIELQRGPAAVRYGGNALNGAINLIDGKVPKAVPKGGVAGATEVRYGTGDDEKTVVARVTAGSGAFAIHAEGARHTSEDYAVPSRYGSGRLRHSFADSTSYSAGASWVTSQGYVGAAFTRQKNNYGLPGHSHANGACHTHAIKLHCAVHGNITDPFEGIDDSLPATIDLRSDRIDVRADYDRLLPGLEHLRLRLSSTDYIHDEIDGRVVFSRYKNKVHDGRVEATHAPVLGFTGTFGVQLTDGLFSGLDYSDAHLSGEPMAFQTKNSGMFFSESKSIGNIDIDFSVRKDWRKLQAVATPYEAAFPEHAKEATAEELLEDKAAYNARFARNWPAADVAPLSASLGANWKLAGGYTAGLSVGQAQRAAGVRELYARNNNLATNSYEVGLARTRLFGNLLPPPDATVIETAKSVDLNFSKQGGAFTFEAGLFYKKIDNYIFARLVDTEPNHLFLVYTPADVRFVGLDGQVSYQVDARSRVTLFGDYVDANLQRANDKLPRVPPGRLGVRHAYAAGPVSAEVDVSHTFTQFSFASYETRTAGYNLVNATLAYRFDAGSRQSVEFYVRGTNLTNQLAYAHTSFVKQQSPLRGRNVVIGIRQQF